MDNWIVIIGNPLDGFDIYGPFLEQETALEFAELQNGGREWWITKLKAGW